MIEDARHAHPRVSVRRLCELHGVSRSWFYEQQSREAVEADQALSQDTQLAVCLKAIQQQHFIQIRRAHWNHAQINFVPCETATRSGQAPVGTIRKLR